MKFLKLTLYLMLWMLLQSPSAMGKDISERWLNYVASRTSSHVITANGLMQPQAPPQGGSINFDNYIDESAISLMKVDERQTPDNSQLLGERIDLNSGGLSFQHTDVAVPGNFALPVEVTRTYRGRYLAGQSLRNLGDWSLEIPNIHTNVIVVPGGMSGSWGKGKACSGGLNPGYFLYNSQTVSSAQYWNGDSLNVAGKTNEKLLRPNGPAPEPEANERYTRRTKTGWIMSCIDIYDSQGQVTGEGFKARAPDGSVYYFDVPKMIETPLRAGKVYGATRKYDLFMLVSRVRDRFGNEVTYHYDDSARLLSISASDGRAVQFTYHQGAGQTQLIASAQVGNRTWYYQYDGQYQNAQLTSVQLPDGNVWQFSLAALNRKSPIGTFDQSCSQTQMLGEISGTITSPTGLTGTYTVKEVRHGWAGVSTNYMMTNEPHGICYSTLSLVKKALSGTHFETQQWRYQYSQNIGVYSDKVASPPAAARLSNVPAGVDPVLSKSVTVVAPNGRSTRYFYNRDVRSFLEGSQIAVVESDSADSSDYRTTIFSYQQGEKIGDVDLEVPFQNIRAFNHQVNRQSAVISLAGGQQFRTDYLNYNVFGQYGTKVETGPSGKRYSSYTYLHDLAAWQLNLLTNKVIGSSSSNELDSSATSYRRLAASNNNTQYNVLVPDKTLHNGVWQRRAVSYWPDGNLKKVERNRALRGENGQTTGTNSYILFADYHRGQAQRIQLPARYHSSNTVELVRDVNDYGEVTRITDFKGYTRQLYYDYIGRLQGIRSHQDGNHWLDIAITWDFAVQPQRTIRHCRLNSTGNACSGSIALTQKDRFDNQLNLLQRQESDGQYSRYQQYRWNSDQQQTFKSYWSTSPSNADGLSQVYDAWGRLLSQSSSGGGTRRYGYSDGHQTQVTDERGYITTNRYQAFGQPAYEDALSIDSPEGVQTFIERDVLARPTRITQSGASVSASEYRTYNQQGLLCKVSRDDVGTQVLEYNALGEVVRLAEGVSSNSPYSCAASTSASDFTEYRYDNVGGLWQVDYQDNLSDNVTYQYDALGLLVSVNTPRVERHYFYNSKQLLTAEQMSVGSYSANVVYEYDALGNKRALTFPNGERVNYAPNGLGQATQVTAAAADDESEQVYASAVTYHADGQLKSFSYGNGMQYLRMLDRRQRPSELRVVKGSQVAVWRQYYYDSRDNLITRQDVAEFEQSLVALSYDGLNRLVGINMALIEGDTELSYDGLGNILHYQSLGRDLSYHYNDRQQLISVDGLANGTMNFSYDSRGRVVDNGRYSLTYDKANRLIQAGSHHYRYDGLGRRAQIQYSGGTRYPFYSRDGQLLSEWRNGKTTNYIHLQGQLIAKSGHIDAYAGKQHYRAFGESIEGSINDVGYTGHVADSDTGLVYMQARYYDPVIGRFYSNDPIGFRDLHSFNRYAYANNNPYKYTDPDGQDAMITHMKNGSIQIDIPTKFTGPLATKQNIQAIKTQVSKKWSGTYKVNGKNTNVTVNVTDAKSGIGPKNEVTLLDKDPASGRSYVQGNKGEWNASGDNMTSGMVEHEAGHLMGADDQYYEGTGMALPGHENDIMGNLQGTPQDSTMKEILDSDRNWTKKE